MVADTKSNTPNTEANKPADKKTKKDKKEAEELSEEDKQLNAELELLVTRIQDADEGVQRFALQTMGDRIKSATASMTSVPKPLKFLRPFYDVIVAHYNNVPPTNKALYADTLSVLSMTMAPPKSRSTLRYKLQGTLEDIGSWGHEYIKHLASEIGEEYQDRVAAAEGTGAPANIDDLMKLVNQIVPFDVQHNVEAEACDLLYEVEQLPKIVDFVDDRNYSRIVLYLLNVANFVPEPEDAQILRVAYDILRKMKKFPEALRIALRMNNRDLVREVFFDDEAAADPLVRKQMAFMLGRQRMFIDAENDELNELIGNGKLNQYFLHLAKDLDSLDPKTPEDIYKSHLTETRPSLTANIDSARKNLASTFVNAFVNAGYGNDKLMMQEGNNWLYKNKEHGMMSAAASLGMLLLWDVEGGLAQIDKYLYSTDNYIKAGALMAVGIVNSGVRSEVDPALALLQEHLEGSNRDLRLGAIVGLGLAYAGTAREDLFEILIPHLADSAQDIEVVSFVALSLGLIYCGTCNEDISGTIMQVLMERDETALGNTLARFLCLALGLLFLGKQEAADAIIETSKTLSPKIAKYCEITVETCAYAGTGNVLKVQRLLSICGEHEEPAEKTEEGKKEEGKTDGAATAITGNKATSGGAPSASTSGGDKADKESKEPKTDTRHLGVAVIGIAIIAMQEDIGMEMSARVFDHLLQYGDLPTRRAVPLALGLINISNPKMTVMDTLSKLSHDTDAEVSQAAILALGLIGAGTNNARIAQMLRQLASYYGKDPNHLFIVRIAQGLLFLGKGLMTLSPYHSERVLLSPVALAGLLTVMHAGLDMKDLILGKYHYLLYYLVCSMSPRMMITVDEDLNPVPISVRVGTAVDVVAQAGRPKTITGFQTHNTPVLLQHGEKAEFSTEECKSSEGNLAL
eukprot:GEZU01025151.1.p1 GENE.GEZU01025151.1~~GEZU01025151.1.p1  ORF type:complete len:915 (-),score=306.66 GEZU01025151.1:111-2855(-)